MKNYNKGMNVVIKAGTGCWRGREEEIDVLGKVGTYGGKNDLQISSCKNNQTVTSGGVWDGGMLGAESLIIYSCLIKHGHHCRTFDKLSYCHPKVTLIKGEGLPHSLQS